MACVFEPPACKRAVTPAVVRIRKLKQTLKLVTLIAKILSSFSVIWFPLLAWFGEICSWLCCQPIQDFTLMKTVSVNGKPQKASSGNQLNLSSQFLSCKMSCLCLHYIIGPATQCSYFQHNHQNPSISQQAQGRGVKTSCHHSSNFCM